MTTHDRPAVSSVSPEGDRGLRDRIARRFAELDARDWGYDHGFVATYGTDEESDAFVDAAVAVVAPLLAEPHAAPSAPDAALRTEVMQALSRAATQSGQRLHELREPLADAVLDLRWIKYAAGQRRVVQFHEQNNAALAETNREFAEENAALLAERDADRADLRIRRNALASVLALPHVDDERGSDFYDLVENVAELRTEASNLRAGIKNEARAHLMTRAERDAAHIHLDNQIAEHQEELSRLRAVHVRSLHEALYPGGSMPDWPLDTIWECCLGEVRARSTSPAAPADGLAIPDDAAIAAIVAEYSHACPACPANDRQWVVGEDDVREIVRRALSAPTGFGASDGTSNTEAESVGASAIPDNARKMLAEALANAYNEQHATEPSKDWARPEEFLGEADGALALVRSWLSAPATDPELPANSKIWSILELAATDPAPAEPEHTNASHGGASGTAPQRFPDSSGQTNAAAEWGVRFAGEVVRPQSDEEAARRYVEWHNTTATGPNRVELVHRSGWQSAATQAPAEPTAGQCDRPDCSKPRLRDRSWMCEEHKGGQGDNYPGSSPSDWPGPAAREDTAHPDTAGEQT